MYPEDNVFETRINLQKLNEIIPQLPFQIIREVYSILGSVDTTRQKPKLQSSPTFAPLLEFNGKILQWWGVPKG